MQTQISTTNSAQDAGQNESFEFLGSADDQNDQIRKRVDMEFPRSNPLTDEDATALKEASNKRFLQLCEVYPAIPPLALTIRFANGETILERNINEVHLSDENLFLRRYGRAGTTMDMVDVASFYVVTGTL